MADKSYNRGIHSVFGSVITFNKGKSAAGSLTRVGNVVYVVDCTRLESDKPKTTRSMIEYPSASEAAASMDTLIHNKQLEYSS